jgi:hypothetical protein
MATESIFIAPGRIVFSEKPIPKIGPLDALIRITTTTISGTDIHPKGLLDKLLLRISLRFAGVVPFAVQVMAMEIDAVDLGGIDLAAFGYVLVSSSLRTVSPAFVWW